MNNESLNLDHDIAHIPEDNNAFVDHDDLSTGREEHNDLSPKLDTSITTYKSDNSVQIYLQTIGRIPQLSHEQELEIAWQIKDCSQDNPEYKKLCNKLVRANLKLVVTIAKKYSYSNIPLLDLIQEGNTGLIKASEKFEPSLGFKFATYASHWIKQNISKYINSRKRPFKLPQHILDKLYKINKIVDELSTQYHRPPTDQEIAKILASQNEHYTEDINMLRNLNIDSVSLDSAVNTENESTLGDTISADESQTPENTFYQKALFQDIRRAIDESLEHEEKQIIELRFGFNNKEHYHSIEEIAAILNITKDRVRKIEFKALRRLKNSMGNVLYQYLYD